MGSTDSPSAVPLLHGKGHSPLPKCESLPVRTCSSPDSPITGESAGPDRATRFSLSASGAALGRAANNGGKQASPSNGTPTHSTKLLPTGGAVVVAPRQPAVSAPGAAATIQRPASERLPPRAALRPRALSGCASEGLVAWAR